VTFGDYKNSVLYTMTTD